MISVLCSIESPDSQHLMSVNVCRTLYLDEHLQKAGQLLESSKSETVENNTTIQSVKSRSKLRGSRVRCCVRIRWVMGTDMGQELWCTWWRGRPTMEGNTALGASSPAKPAFTRPEPLSHTRAVVSSSSHMSADSGGQSEMVSLRTADTRGEKTFIWTIHLSDMEF